MGMKEFCDHLYDDSTDGYIQVLKLNDEKSKSERTIKIYNTKHEGLKDIVEELHDQNDVFVAPNTMYIPKRRVENIRQFRSLFQDIDCENLGLEKAETVYLIWDLYYEGKIPKPTMVTDSGRGVHLYWRIQNAPYGALNTWQELQDYIYYNLKHLGADRQATDSARVLRLPGTINSKNQVNCKVLYIDDDLEYSMYDLREQYLNYRPKSYQLQMQDTKVVENKVVSNKFFNSYSLHMQRANDLQTLCRLRKFDMKGYRNMAIHCYAYWKGIYVRDQYELEKEVIELNNAFKEPLKDTEVKAVLRCIPKSIEKFIAYEQGLRSGEKKRVSKGMRDKEGYWYKNTTLIERLGITANEQKHMKTIIGTDEKYERNNERRRAERRNEAGLTKKQQDLQDLKMQVDNLKDEGLSLRAIAKELDISLGKVQRVLKK
ncbi:DNA-binding response regulator [Paraclostridium bifermentans]|uniref:DNA-binding response regulator n=1 Tax=Paraclostridium bifermentans TaxID=1490 RepID=UPI00214A7540|nr:DNA-binding response regulator [Paraclostridium bifermentans]MCR1877326.1 DNA-binding response regulator [Paraclostridium bifermentans]